MKRQLENPFDEDGDIINDSLEEEWEKNAMNLQQHMTT